MLNYIQVFLFKILIIARYLLTIIPCFYNKSNGNVLCLGIDDIIGRYGI